MTSDEHPVRPRGGLPRGFLDVFDVAQLPSTHPEAFVEQEGKAIRKTLQQGFLCFGQYQKGYPTIPLKAFFSILIDDNVSDDRNILILDVYDHHIDRVIGKRLITRKDFPSAKEFSLFEFDFTPPGSDSNMEFRIYYMGWAYVLADKIALIDPSKARITTVNDIPRSTRVLSIQSQYCQGNEPICLPTITPESIAQAGGRFFGGQYEDGAFVPSSTGGVEFATELDTSRPFLVECDIDGTIPHWYFGENNGGKVSLFTIRDDRGQYRLSLERLSGDYRGGGRFRVILSDRADPVHQGAAWLMTIPELSGDYTMRHWKDESHRIRLLVHGNRCQLSIDDYTSSWAVAPYPTYRKRQVRVMLGNREPFVPEAALTRFTRFKMAYTD